MSWDGGTVGRTEVSYELGGISAVNQFGVSIEGENTELF